MRALAFAFCCVLVAGRTAQAADPEPIRLGAILDMSSVYADVTGAGSQTAAQMAIDDFGGKVLGRPIQLMVADHQNKPDIAAGIAARWLDAEHVAAILDVAASGPALAVMNVAKTRDTIVLLSGPGASSITGYSATLHYLKAVEASGTLESKAVMAQMRAMPVNDFFAQNGAIRPDGMMFHDVYLFQVKTPEESQSEWDLYKLVRRIPADEAYLPLSQSRCPLVHH